MKVAVLLGGTSAERDVSMASGIAMANALNENGHPVEAIDCAYGDKRVDFKALQGQDLIQVDPSDIDKNRTTLDRNIFKTIDYLLTNKFDVAVNALHGGYGENGQLQASLDLAKIPYTGSGALSSALGMDKFMSKIIFMHHEVPVAPYLLVKTRDQLNIREVEAFGLPLVVKPNDQGSTVGLTIVKEKSKLDEAIDLGFKYSPSVLIERYIAGSELTVSILGEEPLPIIHIIPESGFYDYESKYQGGKTNYEVPAKLSQELTANVQQSALRSYQALGCSGYARVDFRLQEDGQFFCLEVNTLPGMTATSLVPKAAKAAGINFNELLERIINLAIASAS